MKKLKILKLSQDFRYLQKLALNVVKVLATVTFLSDLQNIPYYLSGYRVCSTAYRVVLGLSAAAVTETFCNFVAGVRSLKKPKRRNLTHKRLMAETWMEAFFTRVTVHI